MGDGGRVGTSVGNTVGMLVGVSDGFLEGMSDGETLGDLVGMSDGFSVGETEGILVGAGEMVGPALGSLAHIPHDRGQSIATLPLFMGQRNARLFPAQLQGLKLCISIT